MPVTFDRDIRRIQNAKESAVASGDSKTIVSHSPAARAMSEGEQVYAQESNKPLSLYRKHNGVLWKSSFSKDGNQTVENNLEVRGNTVLNPKVGIGINKPAQMLHIEHPSLDSIVRIGAPSGKTSAMQIYSNAGTYTWQMGVPFNADKFVIDEASISSGDDLVIYTGGIVLMGRTSPAASTKDPVLEVDGYVSFDGFVDRAGTGGSDNGDNIINFNWDGSQLEGWVDTTEVQSNITSDYRIKENVTDVSSGVLEKINSLRPIHYTQKECGIFGQSDKQRTSFIAHEMQEVIPDIINGDKDAVDENDNPIFQGYKHQDLTAYLVKAVQELSAKVTALENN